MYTTHFSQSNTVGTTLNQKIFRVVIVSLVMLCCMYAYVIGKITFNVVARNTFTQEKNAMSSRIGELEVEYLSLSGNVTMDVARASGFSEASNIHYVKKNTGVSRAAFLTHEL